MKSLIILFMFIMMIILIVILLNIILSKKTMSDREKISPFECGFNPMFSTRMPFSIHFFMITLIFLIFDIEIALLIPIIMTLKFNFSKHMISLFFFILTLILGLYMEWAESYINWMN